MTSMMTRTKRKYTELSHQREVDSHVGANHKATTNKKRNKRSEPFHPSLRTKASACFMSLPAEVRNMIYVLVFNQAPNDKVSIITTGRYVKHRAGLLGVNCQINNETRGWLFTWPLTFTNISELQEALERMTPSNRSQLQSITIKDSINLRKQAREATLAKSATLLRDAARSLQVLRLDYWPEPSMGSHEVAKSIYRDTEPLLTAIGKARGISDAALKVIQFQLNQFKAKTDHYGVFVPPDAYPIWNPYHKAWREAAIREYLKRKLSICPCRSKRIIDHDFKARRQG